jgi:hypothetical protein
VRDCREASRTLEQCNTWARGALTHDPDPTSSVELEMPHSFTRVPASLYVASAWDASRRKKAGRLAVMLRGTATVILPLARPMGLTARADAGSVPGPLDVAVEPVRVTLAGAPPSTVGASAALGSFFFSSAMDGVACTPCEANGAVRCDCI